MLVITRKANSIKDSFTVGEAIVKVLKNENGEVTIGIEAPKDISVLRAEVIGKKELEERYKLAKKAPNHNK